MSCSRSRSLAPAGSHRILRLLLPVLLASAMGSGTVSAVELAPGITHLGTTSATTASGTALTLTRPADAGAGDVLVARVASRDSVSTTLTASGWTLVGVTQSAGMLKSWMFIKVLGTAEPGSYAFQLDRAYPMAGTVSAFRGVDVFNPVDAAGGFSGKVNGNSTAFTGLPMTSPAGNGLALWWGTQLWTGSQCPAVAIAAPTGFEPLQEACLVSPNSGLVFNVAGKQLGAAARQPAWSGSSPFANTNIVQTLALRPSGVAISHLGSTTAGALNASRLPIAKPGNTRAGDVLVARVASRDDANVIASAPAGWQLIRTTSSTYSLRTTIFLKIATGAEPADYEFGFSRARNVAGSVSTFSGVDSAWPIDDHQGRSNSGSSVFHPGTGLTTYSAGGAAVWLGTQAADQSSCAAVLTPPGGYGHHAQACLAATAGGIAYDVGMAQLGAAGSHAPAVGASSLAATNTTDAIALRRAPALQVSDAFQPAYVTVGQLWDGLANGQPDTAIPLSVLDQPSGLGASRINPDILYVHSEKDRQTMLAFSAITGQVMGKYRVTIPRVYDWEDMAVGPCPSGSCIFAANSGNARGDLARPDNIYSIVRVVEPDLQAGQTDATLAGDSFPFVYPGGSRRDSEAVMVHPQTGDIYVVTKTTTGTSEVYRFPSPLPAPGTVSTLIKVGELTLPLLNGDSNSVAITAAAMHPAGDRFLVRTYRAVYEYRGTGGTIESAINGSRVSLTDTAEGQGEAIEYALDGSAYYTLSERASAPYTLKRVDRKR